MLSHTLRTAGPKVPFKLVGFTAISGGTTTINTPAETNIGDIILLIQVYGFMSSSPGLPSGFTSITDVNMTGLIPGIPPDSYPILQMISYKIATSSGVESITIPGVSNYCDCIVFRSNEIPVTSITAGSIQKYEGTTNVFYTSPLVHTINTSGVNNRIIAIGLTETPNFISSSPQMLTTDTYFYYDFLKTGGTNYTFTFNPNSETTRIYGHVSFYLEVA